MKSYEERVLQSLNLLNFDLIDEEVVHDEDFNTLPLKSINRCFRANTVEEIFSNLEKEGSEWAKETLEVL